jgi:hypothetical protein
VIDFIRTFAAALLLFLFVFVSCTQLSFVNFVGSWLRCFWLVGWLFGWMVFVAAAAAALVFILSLLAIAKCDNVDMIIYFYIFFMGKVLISLDVILWS